MIVFRAPKGLDWSKEWDGKPIENSFRAHQIPIPVDQNDMQHADAFGRMVEKLSPRRTI